MPQFWEDTHRHSQSCDPALDAASLAQALAAARSVAMALQTCGPEVRHETALPGPGRILWRPHRDVDRPVRHKWHLATRKRRRTSRGDAEADEHRVLLIRPQSGRMFPCS